MFGVNYSKHLHEYGLFTCSNKKILHLAEKNYTAVYKCVQTPSVTNMRNVSGYVITLELMDAHPSKTDNFRKRNKNLRTNSRHHPLSIYINNIKSKVQKNRRKKQKKNTELLK